MSALRRITDGVVTIRPPAPGDAEVLIAGRDAQFRRWLGEGAQTPQPTACIVVGDAIVGWVDYDIDRAWLQRGEVNIGYNVFAPHRGNGYASRAVQLLMHHLALTGTHSTGTLLIHPDNALSRALAARTRFTPAGQLNGSCYYKRPVPPLSYTDDVITIRRQRIDDLYMDLAAKDSEQIKWLWQPGEHDRWKAMSREDQHDHALRILRTNAADFGTGPKWCFAVDATDADYVACIDCDLANERVPAGDANISYAAHPVHRARGYISRAVNLITRFLADHTGARRAHLIIDSDNVASLRVADAVGAEEAERWINEQGRTLVRCLMRLNHRQHQ